MGFLDLQEEGSLLAHLVIVHHERLLIPLEHEGHFESSKARLRNGSLESEFSVIVRLEPLFVLSNIILVDFYEILRQIDLIFLHRVSLVRHGVQLRIMV